MFLDIYIGLLWLYTLSLRKLFAQEEDFSAIPTFHLYQNISTMEAKL